MVGKIWNSESRTWGSQMKKGAFLADLFICAPDSGGLVEHDGQSRYKEGGNWEKGGGFSFPNFL